MSKIEVKDVVCDYGVYENNELAVPILNIRSNADIIADVMKADSENKIYNNPYILFLENLEQFEADMISNNEVWNTDDGLPKITKEFYDKLVELQYERNKLLGRGLDKGKTYAEIEETTNQICPRT